MELLFVSGIVDIDVFLTVTEDAVNDQLTIEVRSLTIE